MDPQKRFLASTLQGAIDAEVVTKKDVYQHVTAEVLAEHVPSEILWGCLVEGMGGAGLGPGASVAQVRSPQAFSPRAPETAVPEEAPPEDGMEPLEEAAPPLEPLEVAAPPLEPLEVAAPEEAFQEDGLGEAAALEEVEEAPEPEEEAPIEEVSEPIESLGLDGPPTGGSIDIDVSDALDDLPPLPDEELAVEDVDWDDK